MFTKKVQTVGTISEFMNGKMEQKTKGVKTGQEWLPILIGSSAFIPSVVKGAHVSAMAGLTATTEAVAVNGKADVARQIITAFDPLTQMVQGLAHPITLLVFTTAGVFWLIGNRTKAIELMQGATIGYIIVQMAPMLMRLLVSVTAGF